MAAVLGGTQSLHTNSFDEALALPTEQAAKIALRTQQVLGYETGVAETVDPLGGSYYVETLTDELERAATEIVEKVDAMGGAVAAIEAGYYQDEIHEAAFRIQRGIETGDRIVVGVNRFVDADAKDVELQQISAEETARQMSTAPRAPRLAGSAGGGRGARGRRGDGCEARATSCRRCGRRSGSARPSGRSPTRSAASSASTGLRT